MGTRIRQHCVVTAAVLACAVLSVTACSSGDDDTSVDETAGDEITVPSEPEESGVDETAGDEITVPSEPEESGVDETAGDEITVPSEPPESMTSTTASTGEVERATAFWEALAAGDRDVAVSLVDPAYPRAGSPFGRAHTLEGQFDWYEAVGWQWTLEECAMGDTGVVECTATATNAWSDALGVEPVTGTFLVRFSEDGIAAVGDYIPSFSAQWGSMVFGLFAEWVETNHPEDAEVMFNFNVDVNSEILALYEVNTERFVEAHQGA